MYNHIRCPTQERGINSNKGRSLHVRKYFWKRGGNIKYYPSNILLLFSKTIDIVNTSASNNALSSQNLSIHDSNDKVKTTNILP